MYETDFVFFESISDKDNKQKAKCEAWKKESCILIRLEIKLHITSSVSTTSEEFPEEVLVEVSTSIPRFQIWHCSILGRTPQ